MSPEFLVTAFFVVIAPGTGVLYTIGIGLSRGRKMSVVAAFGCTLGILPHLAAAVLGLAAVLQASPLLFNAITYLGVGYLLYMAWTILRERGALQVEPEASRSGATRVAVTAVLINLLNPKLSIFFLAFLPQFVTSQQDEPLGQMAALGGVFMVMTFVVFAGYGAFAASVREKVISRPAVMTWLRRGFAAAFFGLGIKLALSLR